MGHRVPHALVSASPELLGQMHAEQSSPLFLSVGGETADLLPGQHVVLGSNLLQGNPRFPLEPGYCWLIRCKVWPTSPFDDVILHKLLDSLSLKPTPRAAQP